MARAPSPARSRQAPLAEGRTPPRVGYPDTETAFEDSTAALPRTGLLAHVAPHISDMRVFRQRAARQSPESVTAGLTGGR